MQTLLTISIGLSIYICLLLLFQTIDILNLKKRKLKGEQIVSPPKTNTEVTKPPAIIGKTKPLIRQAVPSKDSPRQADTQTIATSSKPPTFTKEDSSAPLLEQVEYEVNLPAQIPIETPPEVDCFEEDIQVEVTESVVHKELKQLNHLMHKKELDEPENQQALAIVTKIDRTDFFETLVNQFEKQTGNTLLSGLRAKIKERELAALNSKSATPIPQLPSDATTMTDEELTHFL